ncbi:hypothetical protein [Massilia arenae]|uniref:Uncharacterized protein n=1 Tax=Massilia arenae TaxID=2603288 RepID=A0A5C7G317_9BURK|nr:hypothetical protein [Massilia arenae]TXF97871.1 hypothetical protein FVD38_18940 [Massilia arenae]
MPHIQFVHQGRRQADLLLVIALWHELMSEWHPEHADPLKATTVCGNTIDSMPVYLARNPRKACSFETMLRLASGVLGGMHATKPFFADGDNAKWFEPLETSPRTVQLTPAAIEAWNASATAREAALVAARARIESDLESNDAALALLPEPRMQEPTAGARPAPAASRVDGRAGHLAELVRQIHAEPFQPAYRKKTFGAPVTGWDARLKAYFWPLPAQDYVRTSTAVQQLAGRARALAEILDSDRAWGDEEGSMAVALAHDIFAWGGVPQNPETVTPATVREVFLAALNNHGASKAHMNSGWTKVAAFATAHLEDHGQRHPQVIWDSRVATAIIGRLDRIAVPASLFPGIGTVPGQGGTRPRPLTSAWPQGYRSWASQVAGSALVREIRDILNRGDYPKMPLPDGGEGPWTTRGVEMVLFMDGY